jgi:hypothetical protein
MPFEIVGHYFFMKALNDLGYDTCW